MSRLLKPGWDSNCKIQMERKILENQENVSVGNDCWCFVWNRHFSTLYQKKQASHTQNTQSFSIALNTDKFSVFTCHGQSKMNWKQDNTSKHFVLVLSVSIIIAAAADINDNCQMDLMDFGFWVNCSNECGVHLYMQWWEWRWDWVEGEYLCVCVRMISMSWLYSLKIHVKGE